MAGAEKTKRQGLLSKLLGRGRKARQEERLESIERALGRIAREQAKANLELELLRDLNGRLDEMTRFLRALEAEVRRQVRHLEAAVTGARLEAQQSVQEEVVGELISLLDDIHQAIQAARRIGLNGPVSGSSWIAGLERIHRRGEELLSRWGVEPISAPGMPFDPELHEAVDVVAANRDGTPVVVEEVRRGYRWGDSILRLAKVMVQYSEQDNRN